MASTITLGFGDGTTEQVEVRPALLVKVERHFKGDVPPIEGSLYACWLALRPGIPFEQWMDTVDTIDQGQEAASGPLDQAPSPAS